MQFKKINDHYSISFRSKLYVYNDSRTKSHSTKDFEQETVKSKLNELIDLASFLKNKETKYHTLNNNLLVKENILNSRKAFLKEKEEKYQKDYQVFLDVQDKHDLSENSEDNMVLNMINEIKQQLTDKLNLLVLEEEEIAEEEKSFNKRLECLTLEEKEGFIRCERDYYNSYLTKEGISKGKNSDETSERINLSVMKLPKTVDKEDPELLEELSVEIKNLEKKVTKLGGYQNMVRKHVRKNYHEESTRPSYTKNSGKKGNSSVGHQNKSCEEASCSELKKNNRKKNSAHTTASDRKNKCSFNYIKKYDLVDFSLSISDFLPKRNKQSPRVELFQSSVRNLQNTSQTMDENLHIEFKSKIFSSKSSAEMIFLRTAKD